MKPTPPRIRVLDKETDARYRGRAYDLQRDALKAHGRGGIDSVILEPGRWLWADPDLPAASNYVAPKSWFVGVCTGSRA